MTTTTPNQGLTLPVVGDLNAVPTHMGFYNDGVENRLVQRFLSAVDRSVRNPTPNEGEISFLRDVDRYEWHNGAGWVTLFAGGAWTPYTPTWGTLSGTAPVIGNGTLAGRYQQIGKTVNFYAQITIGTTTVMGSVTSWTLSLPVPALVVSSLRQIVPGRVFDSSPSNAYMATGHIDSPNEMALDTQSSTTPGTDPMHQGFPITFASGDTVHFSGTYEAA